jgi:hypothetical protein
MSHRGPFCRGCGSSHTSIVRGRGIEALLAALLRQQVMRCRRCGLRERVGGISVRPRLALWRRRRRRAHRRVAPDLPNASAPDAPLDLEALDRAFATRDREHR